MPARAKLEVNALSCPENAPRDAPIHRRGFSRKGCHSARTCASGCWRVWRSPPPVAGNRENPCRRWYILKRIYETRFDWDENKNRINRAKHGIDFAFARLAFDDPFAITIQDRDIDGEQRYQLLGAVYTRVILVAHAITTTVPGEEEQVIRIISARKATPSERKRYEENYPEEYQPTDAPN